MWPQAWSITARHQHYRQEAALNHLLAARVDAAVQLLAPTVQEERPEVEIQRCSLPEQQIFWRHW